MILKDYWGWCSSVHFVLGSKSEAERKIKEFYREMILKNYCIIKEEEGAPLKAAVRQFVDIATNILDMQ